MKNQRGRHHDGAAGRMGVCAAGMAAALTLLAGTCVGQTAPAPIPAGTVPDLPAANPAIVPFESRPVREVKFVGLEKVTEQFARNQVRSAEGTPLKEMVVREDVRRLTRTGKFERIDAQVTAFSDGTVLLTFVVVETPVVRDARAVGNRQIPDSELAAEISLLAGAPVDRYRIDQMIRQIKQLYRKKGYYYAEVTINEEELKARGNLIFQIREGERLKVTDIRFEGNKTFEERRLRPSVSSETWGIFSSGAMQDDVVDKDVAEIIKFYKDRGYLDVRVDREVRPSPDGKEAILTFIIDEGPVYTLRSVRVQAFGPGQDAGEGPATTVLSPAQVAALMPIKAGDVYSADKITKAVEAVQEAYGQMGYVDSRVQREELRNLKSPEVDLLLTIEEGRRYLTGAVIVKGNEQTQDKVIRRLLLLEPDRPLDTTKLKQSELGLEALDLFDRQKKPSIKVLGTDPTRVLHRDILVEVKETNTGKIGFGAAVNSGAGLIGTLEFSQRNFDKDDWPESWSELFAGRAFRGAGQGFSILLQPGTTYQAYTVSFSEPFINESVFGGSISGGYVRTKYDEYSDGRASFAGSLARRFGDLWSGGLTLRADGVMIDSIRQGATVDLMNVQGSATLIGIGASLGRQELDRPVRPTKGSTVSMSLERVTGDYNYTRVQAQGAVYIPLHEDFFGHSTVLQVRSSLRFMPEKQDDVPLYERHYGGGGELRGFATRGVSPRGVIAGTNFVGADPVGGIWSVMLSAQVEQPLFKEFLSVVAFVDSGTVNESHWNVSKYRVSAGVGLRVYLPMLGPAPLQFDLGIPLKKEEHDVRRWIWFSIDVPF